MGPRGAGPDAGSEGLRMKKFSLAEAQALLPVAEALLDRATASALLAARLEEKAALLRVRIFHAGGLAVDVDAAFRDASERRSQKADAANTLGELERLGVLVKDLAAGILDFPCDLNGEAVLLCWQRGEARIGHWHALDEGFSERQSLNAMARSGSGSTPDRSGPDDGDGSGRFN